MIRVRRPIYSVLGHIALIILGLNVLVQWFSWYDRNGGLRYGRPTRFAGMPWPPGLGAVSEP